MATEYRHLCLLAWTYGLGLGSFRYSMKMLALERIRAKHFTKAWGFIKTAEAIPVLFGVPLVSFLNEASSTVTSMEAGQRRHILHHGRAGYFVCAAAAAISTVLLFFIGHPERRYNKPVAAATTTNSCNGSLISHCGGGGGGGGAIVGLGSECPDLLNRSFNSSIRYGGGAAPPHWYPSPYTTNTVRCSNGAYSSSMYPGQQQQHHHPVQQLPPAYNSTTGTATVDQQQQQQHCQHRVIGGGSVGGGGGGGRSHPPRLQKSFSFAFQTSPSASIMWNEPDHRHHHQHHQQYHPQQQQQHAVNGGGPCFYSRCSSR